MANPWAAEAYGASTQFENPGDVNEFKPSRIVSHYRRGDGFRSEFDPTIQRYRVLDPGPLNTHYPHAGILNTNSFLFRYPTTATNRNRARSRWTYYHFLGSTSRNPLPGPPTRSPSRIRTTRRCTPGVHGVPRRHGPRGGAYQNYGDEGVYKDQRGGLDSLDKTLQGRMGARSGDVRDHGGIQDRAADRFGQGMVAGGNGDGAYAPPLRSAEAGREQDLVEHGDRACNGARRQWRDGQPPGTGDGRWRSGLVWPVTIQVRQGDGKSGPLLRGIFLYAACPGRDTGGRHLPDRGGCLGPVPARGCGGPETDAGVVGGRIPGGRHLVPRHEGSRLRWTVASNSDNSVQWLAKKIVADERFAEAAVKFWWPAIMGSEVAEPPEDEGDADFEGLLLAANAQGAEVERLARGFRVASVADRPTTSRTCWSRLCSRGGSGRT